MATRPHLLDSVIQGCRRLNTHHGWAGDGLMVVGLASKWPESERIDKNDYEEGQNRERGEKCSSMCSSWSKQNKINHSKTFHGVYGAASIFSTVSSLVFRFHPFMVATRLTNPTTWLLLYSCRVQRWRVGKLICLKYSNHMVSMGRWKFCRVLTGWDRAQWTYSVSGK